MQWLRRRIHPTWLFTASCFGCLGGIALAQWWHVASWALVFVGGVLVLVSFAIQRRIFLIFVFIAGLCIGLARGGWGQQAQSVYSHLYQKHVVVSGVIADDVDLTSRGTMHVHLRDVRLQSKQLPGVIFVSIRQSVALKRSDHVMLDGMMSEGFGNFPASMTGAVIHVTREAASDVPRDIRDAFADDVRRSITEPESSLGIGYLLGQKNNLPSDLVEALKVTALTHIVVASGYNLTILVRLGRRLFAKVSKYLAMLTSVSLIIGFVAMTGLSPSMTRAGLVSLLSLCAWYVGRKFHPVTLLTFAAMVTALANPSYVWGDLGWLLSFGAFAGVVIVAPILSAYYFGEKVPFVGQILIETFSAQLVTLPIMIVAFQQLSVIGLLANLLVLPLVPLAMLLVAIAGVGGWLVPAYATVIGWPAQILLSFQIAIINWCANIPWALAKPQWQWWHAAMYFAVVTFIVAYMKWRSGVKLYQTSVVE